ncbi:hypothetical protein OSTOST_13270, partial [Ostertagia ostertagi]
MRCVTGDGGDEAPQAPVNSSASDTMSLAYRGNADDIRRIRIKIGHIGALNALRNDAVVLELSRKSLRKERILDDDFDVELVSQNGCGESYEGVAVAADMYHLQKVKVFIGPYCDA